MDARRAGGRGGGQPAGLAAEGLRACIPYDLPDLVFNILHTGGGPFADLLNVLLPLPLTTFLVLATRRVPPALAVAVLLPLGVEFVQSQLPGRACTVTDLLTNAFGALVGVAVGWFWHRRLRPSRAATAGPSRTCPGG